ncbi:unnamed protein product [Mycena citricolor]|uniref:Uncharacterized protein n=1 Tax=Mycena citricolor TaxID=2018698 RepID=A0AAD2H6F6_9AGAR|nr:unnamed protein product [Mycena citricolor]
MYPQTYKFPCAFAVEICTDAYFRLSLNGFPKTVCTVSSDQAQTVSPHPTSANTTTNAPWLYSLIFCGDVKAAHHALRLAFVGAWSAAIPGLLPRPAPRPDSPRFEWRGPESRCGVAGASGWGGRDRRWSCKSRVWDFFFEKGKKRRRRGAS